MNRKIIFLLIGQKGSGKSFIGSLMNQHFNIKFLRVEDWVKNIKKDRSIHDKSYLIDAFHAIEIGVRQQLNNFQIVTFESTGLTEYFDQMLNSLKMDFKVVTILVKADSNICLHRVKNRDAVIHINISDEQVININKKFLEKNFKADFQIDNNDKTKKELLLELQKILISTAPNFGLMQKL